MAIIETLLEQVSVKSITSLLIFAFILRAVILRGDEYVRVKRLGNYGPKIKSWAPLGLDVIYWSIHYFRRLQVFELWRDGYFRANNSYTVETRVVNQRVIFTADPENIKAILATHFTDFGKGKQFHEEWEEFLGDSIFATDGAQWQNSRQLIRPQFTRERVSDLECFESHIDTLFRAMANGGPLDGAGQGPVDLAQSHGRVIDISDLFFRYTLDVATDFLLGADVHSLSTPKHEFAQAFDEVQRIQCVINRAGPLRWLVPKGAYRANLRIVNNFVHAFIDRTLRLDPSELGAKGKEHTFLHELARFTRDPKVIRDQVIAILLAGRDTTAGTLSWAIYELARKPEAVTRLRTEIIEMVGLNKLPTYEHLKNMPYLKAVINEILRLYPSVPFNVRWSVTDTVLPHGGGPDGSEPLPVLKDTPIGYSPMVLQRRPDLYPQVSETFADPAVFSPERWAHWHPRPHDYIPFNSGPRICIGQQFALTEMSYVLCRIFQRFSRLESHMMSVDGGVPAVKADITISPAKGVYVAFFEDR